LQGYYHAVKYVVDYVFKAIVSYLSKIAIFLQRVIKRLYKQGVANKPPASFNSENNEDEQDSYKNGPDFAMPKKFFARKGSESIEDLCSNQDGNEVPEQR
jgi:hypothetical protein